MNNRTLMKSALVMLSVFLVSSCSSMTEKAAHTPAAEPRSQHAQPAPFPRHDGKSHSGRLHTQMIRPDFIDKDEAAEAGTYSDIWDRLRDGFAISDHRQLHADTEQHLQWFVDNPEYVDRVVERARPYLHYIVEQIEGRGMPMEIALLPVVESGYRPDVYSTSNAAGLWQFIPGTGRVFGLDQNWWYDGRRDVIASTHAALDYLEKLHNDFGDWQLALAAYNCGEGTVGRAIKKNEALGKPTDFWSLELPAETSAYVPKLMAVSHLVMYPDSYDIALSPIDNEPYLAIVDVGSQIDLAMAARMAGVDEEVFHMLNPGFNRWATAPDGPHALVVPQENRETFETALAAMPASERVQWARHQIQRGETLSTIARRYQTTVAILQQANDIKGQTIRAGSDLLIPSAAQAEALRADTQQVALQNDSGDRRKTVHTVRSGDTWWDIARNHNLDVRMLASWNGKQPGDMLQPGQQLVIWIDEGQASARTVNYVIRDGDSLWAISRKFKVSVAQVREWNGLSDRALLLPGQNLTLYLDET